MSRQELLKEAWLGGRQGNMSGQTQAKAWALRGVWKDEHGEKTYGMLTHIASKLYTITPPRKKKEHPSSQALGQLFDKMDNDQEWFPGKSDQARYGPAPALNGTNQGIIARSAMTMKESGKEVTYPQIVAHNPKACVNPATNRPVHKKQIYKVLKRRCHDDPNDPEDKWVHDYRLSKKALTVPQIQARYKWALELEGDILRPQWCHQHLIWTDICNSILPRTENMHNKQVVARKGRKGWGSKKTKKKSKNLQGEQHPIKQNQWGTIKVWWAPVLARGKLHIEILGTGFPGEVAAGAAILVGQIRKVVDRRFPGPGKPKILFVDRGQGFYHKMGGKITPQFKAALRENSLKAYYGDDAKAQPGKLQELMLHETAVAWIRHQEEQTRPKEPWLESVADYTSRMKGVAQDINSRLKVHGLCRAFPKRVTKLIEAEGDRISPYSAFLRTKCTGEIGISLGALCLIMRCKVVGQSFKRPQGEKLKKQREAEGTEKATSSTLHT